MTLRQTNTYVNINCAPYLQRVFERHGWLNISDKTAHRGTPMTTNKELISELENTLGPKNPKETKALEKQMGFSYRAAVGELIYALITCRPDISFAITKLSQYSMRPAKCHYIAIKNIFKYLLLTINEGLTYWRSEKCTHLPEGQ